jgi:hypothetical protein
MIIANVTEIVDNRTVSITRETRLGMNVQVVIGGLVHFGIVTESNSDRTLIRFEQWPSVDYTDAETLDNIKVLIV